MASFFQPGKDDPAIAECDTSTYEVYCNAVIPADRRFTEVYQVVNFTFGLTAIFVPIILFFIYTTIKSRRARKPKNQRKKVFSLDGSTSLDNSPMHSFRPTKTFTMMSELDARSSHRTSRLYDLVIWPLAMNPNAGGEDEESCSSVCTSDTVVAKMSLASVNINSLGYEALEESNLEATCEFLSATYMTNNLTGFMLQVSDAEKPELVDGLLERMNYLRIPIILSCDHDSETLDSVSLSYVSGLILENALILADGEPRDYFRAKRLRNIMARCYKEREDRLDFFIGFITRWETRPHPATVRRAVKLAEHFGGIFTHSPLDPDMDAKVEIPDPDETLSGFEYIRRSETIELQKAWVTESRPVSVPNGSVFDKVAALSLEDLDTVIPQASQLLEHLPLSYELEAIKNEQYKYHFSYDYIDQVPARANFWESSSDGHFVSATGCFPITSEPQADHYDAIVDTQQHLRDLNMLHTVEGAERENLVKALNALAQDGKCDYAVHDLISGIVNRLVRIYKGLDTGFAVPDSDAHFWGVSATRKGSSENHVDIYISQKAPSDAATLLHTWMAHKRIPRSLRFEEELSLEMANNQADSQIPLSIKTAIDRATYSEVLSLLQKLRVSQTSHPMRDGIKAYCRAILIEETTKASWTLMSAKAALDDSTSMRDLLRMRLEHHVKQGATELPSLDNLVELYELSKEAVVGALFYAQRDALTALMQALLHSFDPWNSLSDSECVDVNADLFALIFFSILRRAAFEEVYNESTDRCPMFVSQPDQAAVFSELWILGSQCDIYFSMLPRDIGNIIYHRYRTLLEHHPPLAGDRTNNEIMTMYFSPDASAIVQSDDDPLPGSLKVKRTPYERYKQWKKRFAEAGAMSIFCLPAIVDVLLLTFVGRGCFMTAFMEYRALEAAGYALLVSLLITAGVTGWAGSIGNYYLAHYAYDNMVYFHVQRLSGGFILTLLVSAVGLVMFTLRYNILIGLVFVAYLVCITTHLNLLGIMSSMHQPDSPIPSGRNALLQNMLILLIAPIITSFVNGRDLEIYLPLMYGYTIVSLYRYRRICHSWSNWMDNIPKFTHKEILDWHKARREADKAEIDEEDAEALALQTFTAVLESYQRRQKDSRNPGAFSDPLVARVAGGLPYVDWLFRKTNPGGNHPQMFSTAWFTQLTESRNQQRGLIRGLKDHNVFTLVRLARYDIGQTLALFLVALMDRWVMMIWSAAGPFPSMYSDSRARYGICMCISYFCIAAMLLDSTLYKFWGLKDQIPEEKLKDFDHAKKLAEEFEVFRRTSILKALTDIGAKIFIVFGVTTLLLYFLVESWETTILYYLYSLGYTATIIFQFNRCFTTNIDIYIATLFFSAIIGFVTGCILHSIPATSQSVYNDVISQNVASVLAALVTSFWNYKDWAAPSPDRAEAETKAVESNIFVQRRYTTQGSLPSKVLTESICKGFFGVKISNGDGKPTSKRVTEELRLSVEEPNKLTDDTPWGRKLVKTAREMWFDRKITVKIVRREDFWEDGLGDVCSFSMQQGAVLAITVGFMGEAQLCLPTWQPLLGSAISEAVLYHVARSQFNLSDNRALLAEHFLHGTDSFSKRLEFEVASESSQQLNLLSLKTEMELMRHLCLDFEVDSNWETTPQAVREGIVRRILGEPVALNFEFSQWAARSKIDLGTEDFYVNLTLQLHQKYQQRLNQATMFQGQRQDGILPPPPAELKPVKIVGITKAATLLQSFWKKACLLPFTCVKWIAFISSGASNIERELVYCVGDFPLSGVLIWLILILWNVCRVVKDFWVYWILIYHRPTLVNIHRLAQKGTRRTIIKNSVTVELARKTITGFASSEDNKMTTLNVYLGSLKEAPATGKPLFVDTYDETMRLRTKEDSDGGNCTYQYDSESRWPAAKVKSNKDSRSVGYYDMYGRIVRGTLTLGSNEYVFQYHYKSAPKGNSDLLRADYKTADASSDDMLSVFWGKPVDNEDYSWMPSKNIGRIIKTIGSKVYTSEYEYLHRRDPAITHYAQEGEGSRTAITTSPEVWPRESDFLALPRNVSFDSDDLLIYHSPRQTRQMKRHAGTKRPSSMNPWTWIERLHKDRYRTVPTWRLRTELWSHWLKGATLDAVTACWMDELILREEPLLRPYWRARDLGRLESARRVLNANIDQIVAAIDIDTDVSEVTVLAIKTADLYVMGLSKDAPQVTTRPQDCFNDTDERISVVFNDIGCWPVAPGGVSNCRRDLVNGHTTIRNHVLAECANDYGIPRFQIERSVQSLKLLPLWGIDGGTANHSIMDNVLESRVDEKVADTDIQRDVVGIFIPLLMDFIKGSRTKRLVRSDLIKFSNTILSMSKYYEHKDYTLTWQSNEVEDAWVAGWLTHYDDPNVTNPTEYFEIERPTINDFRIALGIFRAYFFIYAVQVPEDCPRVFQSTHHGISSLVGLILKHRRNSSFGIWDHAILWRECCLNISAAQCELPLSVQAMLLASIGLATRLAYFHADVITPCASLFNPTWEIEIGTDKGITSNRNLFRRKIDPIVNGISNMDAFNPVDKIRTENPTVLMLSNVQVIKGVKAAIQAAEIIINRFGFSDYQLVVYGAKDRQPAYALEMEKFIVDNNLSGKVILAGFGNPREILKDAWLFMNSSISEGLPLAIGEAALAGVPIVATEVGATALVLTDPNNPDQRYGEVVPPNDPLALARAQISILSMVGQWTKFTDEADQKTDIPTLPDEITPTDVEWLTKRFYAKAEYRRELGMLSRKVVLHSFHGNRYLREHEQMFWVQWHQSKMRSDEDLRARSYSRFKFGTPTPLRYLEEEDAEAAAEEAAKIDWSQPIMLEDWQPSEGLPPRPRAGARMTRMFRRSRLHSFASIV
ncbi:hypothetical protein EDB81DRAFT_903410 [Dactylonectria macrodidyma]|uniref:Glycosyl transferase n=1 Tax=Dactylonectria macrodidyma TaxID=307937 RepID=A0A9P9IXC5_9HYPO|nr:hypothetical protein EDB81DRAFT_903410 [Dactylonectria macrodidyma]